MAGKLIDFRWPGRCGGLAVLAGLAVSSAVSPALALVEGKDEKEVLRACERQVCDIMLKKSLQGGDLQCTIVKTWAKSSIKNGVDRKISWTSGDARCTMKLHLSRAELVTAMTAPQHKFVFPPHLISCAIEEEKDVRNIRVLLAPEVEFKDGIAIGGKVKVKKVDAPFLFKTSIWTAAAMIDKVGLFQKELLKELNKLSQKRCPEHYGQPEVAAKKPAAKAAAKKSAAGDKPQKTEAKTEAKSDAKPESVKADAKREGNKAEPAKPGSAQARELDKSTKP